MQQEILQMLITGVLTLLTTSGVGSIFYFKQQKKLKELEVKSAEIANESSTNSEWEKLCHKKDDDINRLETKINSLEENIKEKEIKIENSAKSKEAAWDEKSQIKLESQMKDQEIMSLNWYKCEINDCPYRRPPRKYGKYDFPKDGVVNVEN